MMDMQQITKISLAWELFREGIPQRRIAKELGVDRVTVYRWIKGIRRARDLERFLDRYLAAKRGSRRGRVDPLLKRRVWDLRESRHDLSRAKDPILSP